MPDVSRPLALASLRWQATGVLLATAIVAALHWSNDGLWFQGDAPRHAANGLFIWDYLRSLPAAPVEFALSYYARYPVITPLVYPPLFYVIEALAFGLIAPSPYVAKALALAFACVAGLYTLAWARRWAGPSAGWAGACLVLLPGFVQYANAVMLNVPSTALAVGALFHLGMALETESPRHRRLFIGLAVAALLTYYPAAVIVPLAFVWMLISGRRTRSRWLWLVPTAVLALAVSIAVLLPQHWDRNAPAMGRMLDPDLWVFYGRTIAELTSAPWALISVAGLILAMARRQHRRHAVLLALAFPVIVCCLTMLPAESGRYALPLVPLMVIGAFLGLTSLLAPQASGPRPRAIQAALIALLTGSAAWLGFNTRVPVVSGFQEAAAYLREQAPDGTVLYSGYHDGTFGFYVRAGDPEFHQRVVLAHKVLASFKQNVLFVWEESPHVRSASEVAPLLQRSCGCTWIAIEASSRVFTSSERLLREALVGPEFRHEKSFPIVSEGTTQLDFYRFLPPLDPVISVDLVFPSFSSREFRDIRPISSRR